MSEREEFLGARGGDSGGSGLQPNYRKGSGSNASGRRYTQLPEEQKRLIKKGIYWRGRVPDGILSRLDTDARIMMFSWRKAKKAQRSRGSYGRRTGYAAASVARPGYITNFSQQQTPIAKPDELPISPISQDYLQAYGSPFTPSNFFRNPPKIPDPYSSEPTSTWHFDMVMDCRGNDTGNVLLFKFTEGFKFGNWDVQGGINLPPLFATPAASIPAMLIDMYSTRFVQHAKVREQFSKAVLQSDKHRYVGSGVKMHDIGAVETQSGRIMATHCEPGEMYQLLYKAYADAVATPGPSNDELFICNVVGIYGGMAGPPTSVNRIHTSLTVYNLAEEFFLYCFSGLFRDVTFSSHSCYF